MNQNPTTLAECSAAISQRMGNLRPGDVITNLSEGDPTDVIVVLIKSQDGTLVLSERAKTPSPKPDINGPFFWSHEHMAMLSQRDRSKHQHIGQSSQVKKGAGLVELGKYLDQNPQAVEVRTQDHRAFWSTQMRK